MTVKEVSEILGVSESYVREKVKSLFPDIVRNGMATYMNEGHVTIIKNDMGKNPYLTQVYKVKTDLEKKMLVKQAIQILNDEIEQLKPKADYYDKVLQSESLITTTQIAQDLGITANLLNKRLKEWGVQYKVNGQWILTEKYKDRGYTKSKTHAYVDDDGVNQTNIHTYWTESGREFIMDLCITGESEE